MKSIKETRTTIMSRVTYHNTTSGWSVLRVLPLNVPGQQTRAKQLAVLVGSQLAFSLAVQHQDTGLRQTVLQSLNQSGLTTQFQLAAQKLAVQRGWRCNGLILRNLLVP